MLPVKLSDEGLAAKEENDSLLSRVLLALGTGALNKMWNAMRELETTRKQVVLRKLLEGDVRRLATLCQEYELLVASANEGDEAQFGRLREGLAGAVEESVRVSEGYAPFARRPQTKITGDREGFVFRTFIGAPGWPSEICAFLVALDRVSDLARWIEDDTLKAEHSDLSILLKKAIGIARAAIAQLPSGRGTPRNILQQWAKLDQLLDDKGFKIDDIAHLIEGSNSWFATPPCPTFLESAIDPTDAGVKGIIWAP